MFNHVNQPELLSHIAEVRKVLDSYDGTFSVGEIGLSDDSVAYSAEYVGDRLLHTCYNFSLLEAKGVRALLSSIQRTLHHYCNRGIQPCWAIGNHDSPRVASRWADTKTVITPSSEVVKRNLLLLFSLPGHVCLYQGDELGLPQAELDFEDLVDPYDREFFPDHVGRDGARTPIPWKKGLAYAGFSTAKPWLKVDPRHYAFAVDQQEQDPESVLSFCKELIKGKKTNRVLQEGKTEVAILENDILIVLRQLGDSFRLVFLNYGTDPKNINLRQGEAANFVRGNGLNISLSVVSVPDEGFLVIDEGSAG
jgi:alpha-glucosidase